MTERGHHISRPYWYWNVRGPHGAVSLWAKMFPPQDDGTWPHAECGLDIHCLAPPSRMAGTPPDHQSCKYLDGAPCWLDSSSLAAIKDWIPFWQEDPDDHERVLDRLECEMPRWFAEFEKEED